MPVTYHPLPQTKDYANLVVQTFDASFIRLI